jgi:hypothetical protein
VSVLVMRRELTDHVHEGCEYGFYLIKNRSSKHDARPAYSAGRASGGKNEPRERIAMLPVWSLARCCQRRRCNVPSRVRPPA